MKSGSFWTLVPLCAALALLPTACRPAGMVEEAFRHAVAQYIPLADSIAVAAPGRSPHSLKDDGTVKAVPPQSWTSGFFPGSLWYLYEYTGDEAIRERAERFTANLAEQQFNCGTHDIGFMMFCSYGNGYRLAPDSLKREVLIHSARSLMTRFHPETGVIRSWDKEVRPGWVYPVIIDNMMNLELLLWAWKETDDESFLRVAESHADRTMANHFRPDGSSFHVVNYDPENGAVLSQGTFQGYSDDSSWARGQAWGLYGYTCMARYTGESRYLAHACKIADYITSWPDMPQDKIPYWDYLAGPDPEAGAPRDASAAAVTASALLELAALSGRPAYRQYAEDILRSLSSPAYTAPVGTNGRFLLRHSVTSYPTGAEIDRPLDYADYYYLEALLRYSRGKE